MSFIIFFMALEQLTDEDSGVKGGLFTFPKGFAVFSFNCHSGLSLSPPALPVVRLSESLHTGEIPLDLTVQNNL